MVVSGAVKLGWTIDCKISMLPSEMWTLVAIVTNDDYIIFSEVVSGITTVLGIIII